MKKYKFNKDNEIKYRNTTLFKIMFRIYTSEKSINYFELNDKFNSKHLIL